MKIENHIAAIQDALERADRPTQTITDASKGLGALIVVCGHLAEVIEEQ